MEEKQKRRQRGEVGGGTCKRNREEVRQNVTRSDRIKYVLRRHLNTQCKCVSDTFKIPTGTFHTHSYGIYLDTCNSSTVMWGFHRF